MNPDNHSFQNDERLSRMNAQHLTSLTAYAKELADAPQNQKMSVFLSIQQRASKDHISFSSEDRDLLLQVLTEHMSEDEKKRVKLIQTLASQRNTQK